MFRTSPALSQKAQIDKLCDIVGKGRGAVAQLGCGSLLVERRHGHADAIGNIDQSQDPVRAGEGVEGVQGQGAAEEEGKGMGVEKTQRGSAVSSGILPFSNITRLSLT